ncbi:MAG: hypothetical protein V1664_01595 [Candidatus Uhrbacteria bacterium]
MENPVIQPVKPKMTKEQIFTVAILVAAVFVGMYFPFYLVFLLGAAVGQLFGRWYAKKPKTNPGLIKFIVWSNVLTWISIPIGLFTGFSAWEFSKMTGPESKKYKTLAIVGIVLSLANLLFGVLTS